MRTPPDQIGHAVTVHKYMVRSKWLARRRRGITATDVAAILGMSKYATPLDVFLIKRDGDQIEANYAMQRGNALEPLLIDEWHARNPDAERLVTPALVAHPENRWAMASLDHVARIDGTQTPLEIKTAGWRQRDDWWDETRLIPDVYAVQTLWQLYVTGLDRAEVVADVAGDVRILTIERDRGWESVVVPMMADWWKRHVVGGEEPDIDPVRDYPSLRRLWVPDPGVTIDADPLLMSDIRAYRHAAAEMKERKQIVDELKGRIRIAMREASAITDPDTGRRLVSVSKNGALRVAEHREETTQ